MVTLHSIFDAFGGPAGLGRAIGRTTEHTTTMRRRCSIPVRYWPQVIAAAKERGASWITYETLTLAHTNPDTQAPNSLEPQRAPV